MTCRQGDGRCTPSKGTKRVTTRERDVRCSAPRHMHANAPHRGEDFNSREWTKGRTCLVFYYSPRRGHLSRVVIYHLLEMFVCIFELKKRKKSIIFLRPLLPCFIPVSSLSNFFFYSLPSFISSMLCLSGTCCAFIFKLHRLRYTS
jgi:hypothetical protein